MAESSIDEYSEKRSELRHPIQAGTIIEVRGSGQTIRGVTIDMSASGVLLRCEGPVKLSLDDRVECDFTVVHPQDQPLPYWGIGRVLRVNDIYVAISLIATGLCTLSPATAALEKPLET